MKAVEDQRNRSKMQVSRLGMLSEQRVRNLSEEMNKMRENLSSTHRELDDLRRQLDKEVRNFIRSHLQPIDWNSEMLLNLFFS